MGQWLNVLRRKGDPIISHASVFSVVRKRLNTEITKILGALYVNP